MMRYRIGLTLGLAAATFAAPGYAATVGACRLDTVTLEFAGSAVDQAKCLLRKVKIGGNLENQPLPETLAARLAGSEAPNAAAVDASLAALPAAFRQTVGQPVSNTQSGKAARYFVIHDTSTPYFADAAFPGDLDGSASVNNLQRFMGPNAVAHAFVNRGGDVAIGHDFAVPWRATKLETQAVGAPSRGRFLHIELVQPRRRDPARPAGNDRFSPEPGFSPAQYDRLAALYVVASKRAGRWLIPAFHAALDSGLNDGHDDPQNFRLEDFAAAVDRLTRLGTPPAPSSTPPSPPPQAGAMPHGTPIDEAYRAQFAQCDTSDRFGDVQFPIKRGDKIRWYGCRTDPSRFTRFEGFPAQGGKPAAVLWEAKLAHDLDGSPKACNDPGRTDQCGTTLMLKPTAAQPCPAVITQRPYCLPVNAERIPYVVMPTAAPPGIDGTAFRTKTGLATGDIGMVIANGKRIPVLIADTGPAYKIGEGSTALLAALSGDGRPRTIGAGVVVVAFPGTSPGRDVNADQLAAIVQTRGEDLYRRLMGN